MKYQIHIFSIEKRVNTYRSHFGSINLQPPKVSSLTGTSKEAETFASSRVGF